MTLNRIGKGRLLPGLLVLPLVWAACQKAPEPKRPFALTEALLGDAKRLIPMLATDSASADIVGEVFNGLVKYNTRIELEGDLAESFEKTPDCMSATFHLRRGVKWHDGPEFTANDVLFTYHAIIDPKVVTPYKTDFEPVKEVRVIDPYTVRVDYSRPFAPGLATWGMGILPEHLLKGQDLNTSPFNRNPVGTGPFRFQEWLSGQKITLASNNAYFEQKGNIEEYTARVIPDQATQFLELQALNLDLMSLTPLQYTRQSETPLFTREFNKYKYPGLAYTYMGYNLKDPKFQDRKVRQAIAYAVDKKQIVEGVLFGLGRAATGPYIPESWAYDSSVQDFPYDPEKAKSLLAEAGWKDTDGDGILEKEGKAFSFTLLTNQGNDSRRKTAEMIQQYLIKVGIKVEIRVVEWQSLLHNFIDKRQFEAIVLGWAVGLDPDLYAIWHSSQMADEQFNFVSYQNPEVDALLVRGRETCNLEDRKKIYHEVHRRIAEDQPYLFLYYPTSVQVVHKRFKGIAPSPIGMTYNLYKWTVPKERAQWYVAP